MINHNDFDDYELNPIIKKNSSVSHDAKSNKVIELFGQLNKSSALPKNVFKMQSLDEFIDMFVVISGIIYVVNEEKYLLDVNERNQIRSIYVNLIFAKEYYKKEFYLDYKKAEDLKRLGENEYYGCKKPNRYIVIDWIITKIEDNFRDIRYYWFCVPLLKKEAVFLFILY